jgi:SAM-dependent methyltransferase
VSDREFQDYFSGVSQSYAVFRPAYPEALYGWLAQLAPARRLAWDCATGNGQAAVGLARWFEQVVASDASEAQIAEARPARGVRYAVFPAEEAALEDGSVDLVSVAQALHWFEHDRFYAEVRRVLVPGGVLAAWAYELFRVAPDVDALIGAWYRGPLDAYWPAGRRHIESGYRTLPFPGEAVAPPPFEMAADWTLDQVEGYLGTWSAVKRYRDARGDDPLALLHAALAEAWGDPARPRRVVWPLVVRVARLGAARPISSRTE